MKESHFKNQNYTVIGVDNLIEGDLVLTGDVIVHSTIKGTLTIKNSGKIIFERGSHFEGTIYCEDIDIFGSVEGSINANGALTIRSSGSVSGSVKTQTLTVYPGAVLNMEAHAELQQ